MSYLGSWNIDSVLTFPAITHRVDTGALTDADSVPSYRVYEDETGTAILTGSMAKLDDTNTTGFYSEQITLSAANGFERGKCYTVYITATVNSITGGQHHTFQIGADVNAAYIAGGATSATILNRYWGSAVVTGTADSGTATTMVDAARTEIDDYWNGSLLVFTSGGNQYQARRITDFDNASSTITFSPAASDGVTTENYVIVPAASIGEAVWNTLSVDHQTDGTFGFSLGDATGDSSIHSYVSSFGDTQLAIDAMVSIRTASSGTTTTVTLSSGQPENDSLLGQTISINVNAGAAGVQTAKITGYNAATGVVTFSPAMTAAPQSGDTVAIIRTALHSLPTAAENATAVATTAMTEAYSTDGGTVTLAQGIYELLARDQEISISGTTMTVKKRDGTTTAYTLTLNDGTNPTAVTRSS